jgi:catechol 2,3-dioxygenase-like lactoylglutathione lyase family enzyme
MQIKHVDHFTINVVDANESIRFYGEILGLPRLPSVRMKDHDLYYFQLAEGMRLELIEYDKKIELLEFSHESQGMYRHIAFQVTNIFDWEVHLKANGVRVTAGPSWIKELKSTNMLILDSNGVEIELVEK